MTSVLSVAYLKAASIGHFFSFLLDFEQIFSTILNKTRITYVVYRALNDELCHLLFSIDYFSLVSVLSVAQTTVLISVNPYLTESCLKKQSQCQNG